jgi:CubicO group peptidase (beta-lactamase class C family)
MLERSLGFLAGAVAEIRDEALVAPPGEQFFYSSYGYALLGLAIERAAGRDFLHALDELVLAPLQLRHTAGDRLDGPPPEWVRLYERPDPAREPVLAPEIDYAGRWPGGGLRSTPEDLARFGAALLEGRLLGPAALEESLRSQRTRGGQPTGYGLGWNVAPVDGPSPIAMHLGHAHGGSALLLLDCEARIVLAICANVASVTAPSAEPPNRNLPEPPEILAPFLAVLRSREEPSGKR